MINPTLQVSADLYIHAAAAAVWQKLSRLEEWPRWNSQILEARWLQGDAWQEGSVFQLRHKSLFGTTTTTATVRMCVPGDTVVWESTGAGMTIVSGAQFRDEVGGCKLTARHTYHGVVVYALHLIRHRQQKILEAAMRELKESVEGNPR